MLTYHISELDPLAVFAGAGPHDLQAAYGAAAGAGVLHGAGLAPPYPPRAPLQPYEPLRAPLAAIPGGKP